ncbi:hypothetical protein [Bacillus sp. Bos-x628]
MYQQRSRHVIGGNQDVLKFKRNWTGSSNSIWTRTNECGGTIKVMKMVQKKTFVQAIHQHGV